MYLKNWRTEILTVPNLLSLLRLLLLPVYARIYLRATQPAHYLLAGAIMAVSCLTDLLDGMLARKLHQITNLGKVLDPLADKITQLTLTLCLSLKYPVLHPVLALFIVKEVFQCVSLLLFLQKGKVLPGALFAGKLCTAILFASLLTLVLFPQVKSAIVSVLVTIDSVFLLLSFYEYLQAYFGKNPKLTNLKQE